MEGFIVSARKYRPITFATVVGQDSITTTLKNAVKKSQLAHAYLFCGPRGVGKTTCARIFAKTINCINLTPELDPCNQCESCVSFNESRSFNIRELDAASNNSVDDIRSLIDQVRIPPQVGKYSVFVIDEVHMLSSAAFNAFLKTLEEPPAHAIFILATTEKHKIIPTILSRCQIFDFNRITVEDISKHLLYVAQKEGVNAEIEALHVISQKADGALRDALSIFDQIVSFSGNNITYKDAINNLNILDYDYFQKITSAFLEGNIASAFLTFNNILNEGFDAQHFISGLSEYLRDILVCKDVTTLQLLEVAPSIKEAYKFMSSRCSIDFLVHALNTANQCDQGYKAAINKRLHIEVALMKICRIVTSLEKKNDLTDETHSSSKKIVAEEKKTEPVKIIPSETTKSPEPLVNTKPKTLSDLTLSIKDIVKESEAPKIEIQKEDNNPKQEIIGNKNFDSQEMIIVWNSFAEKLKDDEPRTYFMLTSHLPILKENFLIEVNFQNELQEDIFKKIKPEILSFLKRNLLNNEINIEAKVLEEDSSNQKKLYTDSEKFNYLAEKNPDLAVFKQKFNLDFT
jgi:DNA polymerase III subunit gamma/tau